MMNTAEKLIDAYLSEKVQNGRLNNLVEARALHMDVRAFLDELDIDRSAYSMEFDASTDGVEVTFQRRDDVVLAKQEVEGYFDVSPTGYLSLLFFKI